MTARKGGHMAPMARRPRRAMGARKVSMERGRFDVIPSPLHCCPVSSSRPTDDDARLRRLIAETGLVNERLRVREIDDALGPPIPAGHAMLRCELYDRRRKLHIADEEAWAHQPGNT